MIKHLICIILFSFGLSQGSFKIFSEFAPFPDEKRSNGLHYGNKSYPFNPHYNDSSIIVFKPTHFDNNKPYDLIVYFHGWNNSNDKASEEFGLFSQLNNSKKNAILIFPEGPKNAPDSYGGKLENKDVFNKMIQDVIDKSKFLNIDLSNYENIILSGHSGAYRVIATILNRGGLTHRISQVILFDGLYGQIEKYAYWIQNFEVKFINIITPKGGTENESIEFLRNLDDWGIPYYKKNSNILKPNELNENNILFLFTDLDHNAVINPYFEQILSHF